MVRKEKGGHISLLFTKLFGEKTTTLKSTGLGLVYLYVSGLGLVYLLIFIFYLPIKIMFIQLIAKLSRCGLVKRLSNCDGYSNTLDSA